MSFVPLGVLSLEAIGAATASSQWLEAVRSEDFWLQRVYVLNVSCVCRRLALERMWTKANKNLSLREGGNSREFFPGHSFWHGAAKPRKQ